MSEKQALNAKEWEESEGYVYVGCGGVSKLVGGKWKAFSRHEALEAYAAACTQLQAERIREETNRAENWKQNYESELAAHKITEQRLVSLQTTNENFRETLRGIRSMNPATEGARMKLWASDSLSGHTDSVEGTVKKLSDERNALQAEIEQLRKGWISVEERLPECDRTANSFGIQVNIWPCIKMEGCSEIVTAFYGCRQTDEPNFYIYGRVLDGVTHWQLLPSPPNSNNDTDGQHQ